MKNTPNSPKITLLSLNYGIAVAKLRFERLSGLGGWW
jgi:hypothetical protein